MVPALENYINEIRKSGDSIGAEVTVTAINVPVGLGNPVFDKLDALLAYAMMSIIFLLLLDLDPALLQRYFLYQNLL